MARMGSAGAGRGRTASCAAVIAAVVCLACPARAQEAWSVAPSRIVAGTFYAGASITVAGDVAAGSNVAVRILGPLEHRVFNRRDKIAGFIWGGIEHVTFHHAPTLYAAYTSAALPLVAGPDVRQQLQLGYDALEPSIDVEGTLASKSLMVENLVRLKEREGLYRVASGFVHLEDLRDGRHRFSAAIPIPDGATPGEMAVSVFELSNGRVIRSETVGVVLVRTGMPAFLYGLAHRSATIFGFMTALVMLVTGLTTVVLGDLRHPDRRRRLIVMARVSARAVRDVLPGLPKRARSPEEVASLRAKYGVFRRLLNVNNEVLGMLAELEEESSWASYRHPRVRMRIRALFDATGDMVDLLNTLSGNRFFDLSNVVASIRRDVTETLDAVIDEPCCPLTLNEEDISQRTGALVGGKALNLARLSHDLRIQVPPFFVVTIEAYRQFLEHHGLADQLRMVLAPARLDAADDLRRRCELAQSLVEEAEVPAAIAAAIRDTCRSLGLEPGEGVAVRSSAVGEDSELSFAGQFESLLNVPEADVVSAWKQVVRSRFSTRAFFYRRAAGLAEVDTPMAVVVQRMVRARASGVLFTRRPDQPKSPEMLLSAVAGLGIEVSTGVAAADELVVPRPPRRILDRRIAPKPHRLAMAAGGGVVAEPSADHAAEQCAVTDDEAMRLAKTALGIERNFGGPQDIEWAIDAVGDVAVLQTRPLRVEQRSSAQAVPVVAPLLAGGQTVWPGRAVGPVHVMCGHAGTDTIPTGSILVGPQFLPDCVNLLPNACGVIAEHGTLTGHAASIIREFRVPCLFGVADALATLEEGQSVSLDAASGKVFAGVLWPELRGHLPVSLQGRRAVGLPRVLAGRLTTLNGSVFMSSWTCQSLHDVIRFAHEMAIQQMFGIGDELAGAATGGVRRLETEAPVYVHVLDLGGGVSADAADTRTVTPDQVVSLPFRGLWRGLTDESYQPPLPEAPASAFAAVVMRTSLDVTRALDAPNYACVTEHYLNLNSRQAYHFAVVDAFLSDQENSNHISLRMKGGGAAPWQRALRTEFMADVLRQHQFNARAQGDLLNAWRRGVDVESGMEQLAVIGRLLRFSAQLDLRLASEADARRAVELFVEAEAGRRARPGL